MSTKPIASLSLDLDNKWSYLKTHGDPWETFPTYLDYVVPRFLKFTQDRDLKMTVFVIGQDAVLEKNHEAIRAIADAGHEIGNHSFNHEPWLHLYTPEQVDREFSKTEDAIKAITGKQPVGFRGPGFSLSDEVLRTMIRRGYEYDCSTFPTYLGPIARAYYFFRSRLSHEQKEERKELFGSWKDGFQTNQPFRWNSAHGELLEVPVTTMPIFKVPIHASYILYLGGYSTWLAKAYFWMAMKLCRALGVSPSFLLHPLDFMGAEDDQDLAFFPAMNQAAEHKIQLLSDCMAMLTRQFKVITMQQFAQSVANKPMKSRSIDTATTGIPDELARGPSV